MDRAPIANADAGQVDRVDPPASDQSPGSSERAELPMVVLPSGTTLTVRVGPDGEEILLRSARGKMELRLRLTDDGPVLSLHGVRLEIEATESVAVNCRDFEVNARDNVRLTAGDLTVQSDAEIHMRSGGQTFIDGDFVNLNCLDRTGYHDHVPEDAPRLEEAKDAEA